MNKIRIYQLAKELDINSTQVMDDLMELGIEVKNHMSAIDDIVALKVRKKYLMKKKQEEAFRLAKEAAERDLKAHRQSAKKAPDVPKDKAQEQPKSHSEHKKEQQRPRHSEQPKQKPKLETKKIEKPAPPKQPARKKDDKEDQTTRVEKIEKKRPKDSEETARGRDSHKPKVKTADKAPERPKTTDDKNKKKSKVRDYSKKTRKSKAAYKRPRDNDNRPKAGSKITLPTALTVAEFAELIGRESNEIIMKLMADYGQMLGLNANLEMDVAELLTVEYGYEVEKEKTEDQLNVLEFEFEDTPEELVERSPVVTVMGHVDHGKTSLLDAIRHTNVTKGEAGGITQHIGASEIYIKGKKIVFLDTPGHEAFTSLRARGAKVTDIAILVVAADDGVMPQTIEAIDHARAAGVPIIVAINKIDKNNANPDRVKQELSDRGLVVEEWGGDTIAVEVSAVQGKGIESLLEMVLLTAEMEELKANPNRPGIGFIIEANLDKGRGPVATILVQNGTIHVGDALFCGKAYGKIRAMFNSKGNQVETAGPADSVEIIGLSEVPVAGDKFYATDDEKIARSHAERNVVVEKELAMRSNRKNISLEDLFNQIREGQIKELNLIIKADVHGSIEALKQSLERLSNEEVRVNIIHSQIGAITESDVLLASASNAIIIGFNVRPSSNVTSLADQDEVEIRTYRIIYEAIKDVKDALSGLLDPEYREVIEGKVEVRTTFKVPNIGTIGGAYVLEGKVTRKSSVRLIRDGIVIYEGKISSLKRFKDDAKEVLSGFECGVGLENYNDLKEGDIIETFFIKEIERTLE